MSIDADALAVGDEIPGWEREGTFMHWNRFAAVNYEFAGHHMDDEVGRDEGFPGAFIMAPLSHAYLHALLREWLGEEGRIVSIDMRLKNPLFRGRVLRAGGRVTAIRRERNEVLVDLELWEQNDEGVELAPALATVALPA